jgi:hypothetical protein
MSLTREQHKAWRSLQDLAGGPAALASCTPKPLGDPPCRSATSAPAATTSSTRPADALNANGNGTGNDSGNNEEDQLGLDVGPTSNPRPPTRQDLLRRTMYIAPTRRWFQPRLLSVRPLGEHCSVALDDDEQAALPGGACGRSPRACASRPWGSSVWRTLISPEPTSGGSPLTQAREISFGAGRQNGRERRALPVHAAHPGRISAVR